MKPDLERGWVDQGRCNETCLSRIGNLNSLNLMRMNRYHNYDLRPVSQKKYVNRRVLVSETHYA